MEREWSDATDFFSAGLISIKILSAGKPEAFEARLRAIQNPKGKAGPCLDPWVSLFGPIAQEQC